MGIFFNVNKIVREFEADGVSSEEDDENYELSEGEDENTDTDANSDEPAQDTNSEDEEYTLDEDNGDDENNNEEENDAGDDQPEDEESNSEDDEYTLDDSGESEGEEDNAGDENADNSGEDDEYNLDDNGDDEGNSEEADDSKLKELEGELFDALTPEQKQIKIDELKKCFQELYERCDNIINMINDVDTPNENVSKVFEYVNDNMSDLKQYIYDYFTYTFDTKSYLENNAQYQKYIAILNSFNNILEELVKSNK